MVAAKKEKAERLRRLKHAMHEAELLGQFDNLLVLRTLSKALGFAGAITQGLFRNPMAEPGVLGVSSGAAVAAVLGFVLGLDSLGLWITPALAAVGAVVVLFALLGLAGAHGVVTILLAVWCAVGYGCSIFFIEA